MSEALVSLDLLIRTETDIIIAARIPISSQF